MKERRQGHLHKPGGWSQQLLMRMKGDSDVECEKCKQDKTLEEVDENPSCSRQYDVVDG